MKYIVYIIIFFLIVSCNNYNDLKKYNLKGKVESVTEYEYTGVEKFGKPVEEYFLADRTFLFNTQGNIISYNDWYKKETKIIDIKGNVKEINLYKRFDLPGGDYIFISKVINKFDSKNKIVKSTTYNSSGDLENEKKYIYDSDERLKKTIEKDLILKNEDISYYNKNCNLTKKLRLSFNKKVILKAGFIYDTLNNIIQEDWVFNEKDFSQKKIKYNAKNQVVEENESFKSKTILNTIIKNKTNYNYNKAGKLTRREVYINNEKPKIYNYIYKKNKKMLYIYSDYDVNKNWLSRVEYVNDKLTKIIKRNIFYYN